MQRLRAGTGCACYADALSCGSVCLHARAEIFRRGALISLLLHLNVVAPVVIAAWIYGGREEAQRAEEVDVAFQAADQTELPPDLPPIEPSPETLEPEAKKAPKPDKKRPSW